jgi:hypothetical protein
MPRSFLSERRNGPYLARNWKFESISLHRRVCCEPDFLDQGNESTLEDEIADQEQGVIWAKQYFALNPP